MESTMATLSWRPVALLLLGALFLAATRPAAAGEVRRSVDASPRGRVDVELFDGSIQVEGWDKNEVAVSASLSGQSDDLDLESSGNGIEIEVESRHPGASTASLEVKVPRGSSVRLSVMSGAVEVRGVEGDVDIEAVSGSILVAGAPRKVVAQSTTGAIDIRSTGSEGFELETVSGSIAVQGTGQRIDASSVAGPIRLRLAGVTSGKIETVSGAIDAALEPGPHARLSLESFSATVILQVPPALAARYELETTSGRIDSELGEQPERRREGRRVIDLGSGSADANFRIESFSGDIKLRPLTAKPSAKPSAKP